LFSIFLVFYRNAEDIRREEQEAQSSASNNALTPYDDSYTVTGKLLGSHANYSSDFDEQISTCSCTCLGGTSCANHELLIDQGYHPVDILNDGLCVKRSSV
jgi:potassium channel subfamily K protein 9